MKNLITSLILLISFNVFSADQKIELKAFETVKLSYEEFEKFNVKIKNTSTKQIKVTVNEKSNGDQVKGFGLPGKNNAIVQVENGRELQLKNNSAKSITIELSFVERKVKKEDPKTEYVKFTLRNSSAKTIPLIIPNVMNPNLSAFSNSGVRLKIGQEILFKYKGRKRVLLVVTDDIKDGDKIEVSALRKERIKELESK